ncbi:MAG TPA: hypothetical protein VLY63_14615 [Anaerolineae bacterium]|nr:hypothetical protein [Anaerolineae bacterium]
MTEVVQWAETGLRVGLGVIFMLIPGITFWFTVLGIWVMIRKLGRSNLYQLARNKVRVVFSH